MNVNIGKAVLYQMLGIQPNHKTLALLPSFQKSACSECPYMEAALKSSDISIIEKKCCQCHNCPLAQGQSVSDFFGQNYVNESNTYGKKQKVCRNAILLFMLMHAYAPSKSGLIYNADLTIISKQLGINLKTVKNCLRDLEAKQYIEILSCRHNTATLIILDYKTYFLTANKGGRGYIKLTDKILSQLITIPDILSLRLLMRQLLNSDYESESELSYQALRLSLPRYCKRNVIQKKISSCPSSLFTVSFTQQTMTFRLNEQYRTKQILKENIEENTRKFNSILTDLDNIFLGTPTLNTGKILQLFIKNVSEPALISDEQKEKLAEALASIASRYSYEIVLEAFADVYRNRMCLKKEKIQNIPACVTATIKNYGLDDGIEIFHDSSLAEAV